MSSRATALERIIAPAEGDLPPGLAEYLLTANDVLTILHAKARDVA
jgi:hypothetical protein